jgi:hypothetical protein
MSADGTSHRTALGGDKMEVKKLYMMIIIPLEPEA